MTQKKVGSEDVRTSSLSHTGVGGGGGREAKISNISVSFFIVERNQAVLLYVFTILSRLVR